jgi:hypothetical protein
MESRTVEAWPCWDTGQAAETTRPSARHEPASRSHGGTRTRPAREMAATSPTAAALSTPSVSTGIPTPRQAPTE